MVRRTSKIANDQSNDQTTDVQEQSVNLAPARANAQQPSLPGTSGIPSFLAGRVQNLSDTGLDASKLYTMDETANRAVYITGYDEQDGENGVWHIWRAYVPGLTSDDETEVRIAGGGQGMMPIVTQFFERTPDGVLGIAWHKVYTKTGRAFWQALDPRELFTVQPTVTEVDSSQVPF